MFDVLLCLQTNISGAAAGAAAAGAAAEPAAEVQAPRLALADLERPDEVKVRYEQRSAALLRHARATQAIERQRRKAETTAEQLRAEQAKLAKVSLVCPQLASACGVDAAHGSRRMTEEMAKLLVMRTFSSQRSSLALGLMKPKRAAAWISDLISEGQRRGILNLLYKCASFRVSGPGRQVVLGIRYEMDGASQSISQALIQRLGRPTSRKIATEVHNHSCHLEVLLLSPDQQPTKISETFIMAPLAMLGKTAHFVAAAMQRGIPLLDPEVMRVLPVSVDALVVDVHADLGSSNLPAMRHYADILDKDLRGGSAFFDTTCCEIHVTNRIKSQITELSRNVGKLYSLGNLFKLASTHVEVIDSIERVCGTIVRCVGEPMAEVVEENRRLFDYLFKLSAPHHDRSDNTSSVLRGDIETFLSMVNDRMSDMGWVHWCWDAGTQSPCCEDEADARSKTAAAAVNLFVSSGFAVGSLSRFTHTSMALNKLIAGRVCKRLLPRVLQFGRLFAELNNPEAKAAEEIGSGLADMAQTTSARKKSISKWIVDDSTQYLLLGLKIVTADIDNLQYRLFGYDNLGRKDEINKTVSLTITSLTDPVASPFVEIQSAMARLLTEWSPSRSGPWFLLPMCGINDFDDPEMRFALRKMVTDRSTNNRGHKTRQGKTDPRLTSS